MSTIADILNQNFPNFTSNPEKISQRLLNPLSKGELFGLVISLIITITFIFIYFIYNFLPYPVDFNVYTQAANGIFTGYFYPYWLILLFTPFDFLPPYLGYFIWNFINTLGILYACRVFGGQPLFTLISFQMFIMLIHGQIVGLMVFGIAFFWTMIANRKWHLAGLGLLLASAKIQSGFILASLLWLMIDIPYKHKLRTLLIPLIVTLFSLTIFPNWPLNIVSESQTSSLHTYGSITLWQWIGPWGLILFFPIIFLPLNKTERLLAIYSSLILVGPYFQHADLLTLFILPIHWVFTLFGYIGFNFFSGSNGGNWDWIQILWIIPFGVYLSIILPRFLEFRKDKNINVSMVSW